MNDAKKVPKEAWKCELQTSSRFFFQKDFFAHALLAVQGFSFNYVTLFLLESP